MPFATFTRVREVSSEDNIHLAENLIKNHPGKKWKTRNPGEKSAYVILEMSECHKITGIDIGNEHSAFVEVLVGKSFCAAEDFTEILITCSFMTPAESKSSNNANRVRCFNRETLVQPAADSKWSLVKVICTQPFNKHVSYGLSFIKIHINDYEKNNFVNLHKNLVHDHFITKPPTVGILKFRDDSPDSETENSQSLFNRWKKIKENGVEHTNAASMRIASKNHTALVPHSDNDIQKPVKLDNIFDRNRETLLFGEKDDVNDGNKNKLERLSEHIEADRKRRRLEKENEINKKKCKLLDLKISVEKSKSENDNSIKPSSSKASMNSCNDLESRDNHMSSERGNKGHVSPVGNSVKKKKSTTKFMPFNELLKGVVLVISGIQNPDRGDLRNKAVALGAKYKADWDNTCTHLICAFKNTPKYNQVKGKGKIVTRSWIEKCYSTKKYLPWRRYALDSTDLSKPESDEEIFDDTQKPQINEINSSQFRRSSEVADEKNNCLNLYDIDVRSENVFRSNCSGRSSESDTDDEIFRIKQKTNTVAPRGTDKTADIYEASTDEEDYIKEKLL